MTIPASDIVPVNPSVLGAGGNSLSLNGVIMSKNLLIPTGTVPSFASANSVRTFFGPASAEYALSQTYFLGFDNSTIKPTKLFFAPYNDANRGAWLQSGSLSALSLTQLQALTGTLILDVDGDTFTSSSINLATASSFSDAATKITAGFTGSGAPTCAWNPVNSTFTLSSTTTGLASTITFATGTLSTGLKFTSAAGVILSQGAVADTPTTAMDAVKARTQNWATFMTMWEPDLAGKELFAVWVNAQNQRYMYAAWDSDAQAIVNGSTSCFGAVVKSLDYDGVAVVYNTVELSAFVLGAVASIDFGRTNGRANAAFKHQSGFVPTVTDQQIGSNLLENGYSFYGSYATANDQFNFFYNGQMAGKWLSITRYVNQIYLNNSLQLACLSLLYQINSVGYNEAGYSLIRAAMIDPINSSLNFGSIRTGVTLSESQKAQLNQAAGRQVADIVQQQGYYLQILDPGAQVRAAGGSPIINFWYTDGGDVLKISISSVDII